MEKQPQRWIATTCIYLIFAEISLTMSDNKELIVRYNHWEGATVSYSNEKSCSKRRVQKKDEKGQASFVYTFAIQWTFLLILVSWSGNFCFTSQFFSFLTYMYKRKLCIAHMILWLCCSGTFKKKLALVYTTVQYMLTG